MMRNELKRMNNKISIFCNLYFLSHGLFKSKFNENENFEYKNDHTSKTKNRKNLKINLSFVSVPFHIFHVNMTTLEKKLSENI